MPKLASLVTLLKDDKVYEEVYSELFVAGDVFYSKAPEKFLDIVSEYQNLPDADQSFEEFAKLKFNSVMGEDFSEMEIEVEIAYFMYFISSRVYTIQPTVAKRNSLEVLEVIRKTLGAARNSGSRKIMQYI